MFPKNFVRTAAATALVVGKNSYLNYFEQDEEFHRMGLENVQQTYDLLIAPDWKTEKITKHGDIVSTIYRDNLGKIYKLRVGLREHRINYRFDFINRN